MVEQSGKLQKSISQQFHFDADVRSQLIEMCPPSKAWLKEYDLLVTTMDSADVAVIASLEASATRFLQRGLKSNNKVSQKVLLQQIEGHSHALRELLSSSEIEGTLADPFQMLAEASQRQGKQTSREQYWHSYYQMLTAVELFAKHRLARNVEPDPQEEAVEKLKRRKEYPRFVLLADLLATHQRITGSNPTAYATTDSLGRRRRSDAVEFLSVAVPPILKAARLKYTSIDDQVLKLEIGKIKSEWQQGRRPELAYMFSDWGTRVTRTVTSK